MLGWWGKILFVVSVNLIKLFARMFFKLRVEGLKEFPRTGGLLVACNHVSHLDPPLIGVTIPRLNFMMAKKELFKVKFLEWFMTTVGTILVDRTKGKQALEEAIVRLKQGACITVFPEGTRSTNGRLMKGKAGIVLMAIHSGSAIMPTAIIGSDMAMTKGSKGIKPVAIKIIYSEPYYIDYNGDPYNVPKDFLRRECYRVMQAIEDLLPEHMKTEPENKQKWYGAFVDAEIPDSENENPAEQAGVEN